MNAKQAYAAARQYTDDTIQGAGALEGKPCQIQSITDIEGGKRVTFLWVDDNGVEHTSPMDVMNGETGLGIKSVDINAQNHIIVTYDDDTTHDAGELDLSDYITADDLNTALSDYTNTTDLTALLSTKQPKTLDTPITIEGTQETTVEGALGALNNTFSGTKSEWESETDKSKYKYVVLTNA